MKLRELVHKSGGLNSPVMEYHLIFHLRTNLDDPVLNEITDIDVDHEHRIINIGVTEK